MGYKGLGPDLSVLSTTSGLAQWSTTAGGGAGGGLGVTVADAKYDLNQDYETIEEALDNNETIVNIIADVSDGTTINVPASGVTINIFNDSTITFQDTFFSWSQNSNLVIRGQGRIVFHYTSDRTIFDFNGNSGRVNVSDVEFVDNTVGASGTLTNGTGGRFTDCTFTGDIFVGGTKNIINSCSISSNLTMSPGSINNIISDTSIAGIFVDQGSGTIADNVPVF